MRVLGAGIDLVAVPRIREILCKKEGEHFECRVFSEAERAYCRSKQDPMPHFAARFAAKEAYGKALGLGLGPSGDFTEIEVRNEGDGRPRLVLGGRALEIFRGQGGRTCHLSLSHEGELATAIVVVEGEEPCPS